MFSQRYWYSRCTVLRRTITPCVKLLITCKLCSVCNSINLPAPRAGANICMYLRANQLVCDARLRIARWLRSLEKLYPNLKPLHLAFAFRYGGDLLHIYEHADSVVRLD